MINIQRTYLIALLLIFPAFQSVPAAEGWTQDAGNAQRTGYTAEEPLEPWTYLWSWNGPDAEGGTGGHFYDAPPEARTVMGGGRVYAPAGSSGLYALDAQTGAEVWHISSTAFNAAPAYDPLTQTLLAGGADGRLVQVDRAGAVIQMYETGSPIHKAVLLNGEYVYVVTEAGDLHKLAIDSLTPVWAYAADSTSATPPSYSASRNVIVFATDDLYVHAVNDADGSQKWRVKPSPNEPGGTAQPLASGAFAGNQFDLGWPVIAEQHGVVFVRMQLDHQGLYEGPDGGRFALTNAENRAWLEQNPQWQNLFGLSLDDGSAAFIPAVGYGSTEDYDLNAESAVGVMGSLPVVRLLPDGTEVAYIHFRSGQTEPPSDYRWSGHMGEMVLDDTTVPGLVAGDLRYVQMARHQEPFMGNCDVHIVDEQTPLTMAGDTLINAHWAASCSVRITDRSNARGLTADDPIRTSPLPLIVRAQRDNCPDKNPATHYTTCGGQYLTDGGDNGEGRSFGGPAFWTYWGVVDPPGWRVGSGNTAGTAYSAGFQARYTYVSGSLMVVQGNGGDLLVLRHSGSG